MNKLKMTICFAAALILAAAPLFAASISVGCRKAEPGDRLKLRVWIDDVNSLWAYELHFTVVPLEGQEPNSLAYVQNGANDVLFTENGNSIWTVQPEDGFGAAIYSGNPPDVNEPMVLATIALQAGDCAEGRYEIGIVDPNVNPDVLLIVVDPNNPDNLIEIPFTRQSGTVEVVPLLGDLTGDGCVYWDDLALFAEQWLESGTPCWCGIPADLTGDGCRVDFLDFAIFANRWQVCIE